MTEFTNNKSLAVYTGWGIIFAHHLVKKNLINYKLYEKNIPTYIDLKY